MNANFGIILRKSIIDTLLSPLAPEVRSWGGEQVEIGEKKLAFPPLGNIEFQLYPVTKFVEDHLPIPLKGEILSYAWMSGQALDEYEEWVWNNDVATTAMHPFEKGLLEMIYKARAATIMFAPEGERLGEFVSVEPAAAIDLLRRNVKDLDESTGFMATVISQSS